MLQGLWVESVVPEPGGTALMVRVVVHDASRVDRVRAQKELTKVTRRLRPLLAFKGA